ncbi:MAG: S8 family serine peptidase [Caulobacterales bacterium]
MKHRRLSRIALALAPILALIACDQVGSILNQESAQIEGPAPLDDVPLDARAVSGGVQPQQNVQGLLSAEPLLVAPGEIVVGAKVESELAETAAEMGLAGSVISSLRASGEDALNQLPQEVMAQVRARAEAEATDSARNAARIVLERLGVSDATITAAAGGVVTVNLVNNGASPTSLPLIGQQAAPDAAQAEPQAIEWNPDARCPRVVTQGQLENDVALAMRCALTRLQASRQFEFAEPNFIGTVEFDRMPWNRAKQTPAPQPNPTVPSDPQRPQPMAGGLPNDPLLALQWNFRPRGAGDGQSPGGAGFETFWKAHQIGSREVRVAVIDTGLDLNHPEIRGSQNIGRGIDLISNYERGGDQNGVDDDPNDAGDRCGQQTENSYHGTHVSGTIGAVTTNDRVGVAGGAWNVTIIPVRVLGKCGGELSDIVSGIRWAAGVAPAVAEDGRQIVNATPADIINMSLSIQTACPASMQSAIDAATARGSLVVVAAGNKSNNANLYAPANCQNVIVVAANDERGNMSFYSNFGPAVDILAPGGDIYADSDGDGRPDGILSSRASTTSCYDPLNNSATNSACYYGFLQGTSMAAPHVSSALALLAAQTGLRGAQLEDALFTRALSPIEAAQRQGDCARFPNATPISGQSGVCDRPAGRGMLDLARAAQGLPGG